MTNKQKLSNLIQGKPVPEITSEFDADLLTTPELRAMRVLLRKAGESGMDSLTDEELNELQDLTEKGTA